jgi:putative phage-type endonuclease
LGLNPYRSNVDLWEDKVGIREPDDISDKPYVQYGTRAEEHLRALFALDFPQYAVDYVENNAFISDAFPWAAASLDGWLTEKETGRRGILEIKTTNILQSMQKEKWRDRIPDNYYVQVLFYLAVTGWDFVVLKAQLKFDYGGEIRLTTRHYTIEREDVESDIDYVMRRCAAFWEYVKAKKRPALVLPSLD